MSSGQCWGSIAEERLQTEFVGTHILLAEDEPISQEVSRFLLEHIGLVVDVAEDGQQALARRNTYAPNLMDMQMPPHEWHRSNEGDPG